MLSPADLALIQAAAGELSQSSKGRRAYEGGIKHHGGYLTRVVLTPKAWADLRWMMHLDPQPFSSQSKAVSAALCYFAHQAQVQALLDGMTEEERTLCERLAVEMAIEPSEVAGFALRYLARQLDAGVKVSV